MRPFHIGIIGCGRMGRLHSQRLREDGRGVVQLLFDQDAQAAQALNVELDLEAHIAPTWADVLSAELDAVIVCTPTTSHHDQVLAALDRGWHVLCEKPLAESKERIEALIAAAHASPLRTMLGYQRRCWATYRTLRKELQSGRWGELRAVTYHNVERWEQTIAGTWRDDPAINIGGFLGDAGSHKLDILHFVTGRTLSQVQARSSDSCSAVPIITTVIGTLDGEIPLALDFIGNAQYLGEDLHLHCAEADLMLRDRKLWIARANNIEPLPLAAVETNPVAAFLDLVLDGSENIAPFDCARPVWDATMAILASAETTSAGTHNR